jgi:probable rRNA maturation factor
MTFDMAFKIEINTDDQTHTVDVPRLMQGIRAVLTDAGIESAEISVGIVDDRRMHELNRQFLEHDYPTDVLSFVLEYDEERNALDGEIIASSDYAAREAERYGWTMNDELLLYIIHGCLHLVGHDDTTEDAKAEMTAAEAKYLKQFGLERR